MSIELSESLTSCQPSVYRFLLRLCGDEELASDLTQETLARGLQRHAQLRDPTATRTWLLRIAHNLFREHLRRQQNRTLQPLPADVPSLTAAPDQLTEQQECGKQIWSAMAKLPDRQNQVLHLRVVEQLSIGEIAEVLNLSSQAVRSNLAAARKRMRTLLGHTLNVTPKTVTKK